MPARYVKAYVKRNKNDAADAQAICEAVRLASHAGMLSRTTAKYNNTSLTRFPGEK